MTKPLEKVSVIPSDEPRALAVMTPMDMIQRAVESGADIDMLEKLMGLQERWEAGRARRSFDEAFAKAKASIPPIVRNATGHNSKKYADFAAIVRVIDPVLGEHGLSYRFETNQSEKLITVTCILFGYGHSIPAATLSGAADVTGNKNPIQAIGSTLTYLQRYSLMQALGLAASNDDDGKAVSDKPLITQEQADQIRELLEASGKDRAKFLKWAEVEKIENIRADYFQSCVDAISARPK